MHGFIASPALAKLVATQLIDEEIARSRRGRPVRPSRAERRAARREARAARRTTNVPEPAWRPNASTTTAG